MRRSGSIGGAVAFLVIGVIFFGFGLIVRPPLQIPLLVLGVITVILGWTAIRARDRAVQDAAAGDGGGSGGGGWSSSDGGCDGGDGGGGGD